RHEPVAGARLRDDVARRLCFRPLAADGGHLKANSGVAEPYDAGTLLQHVAGAFTGREISCAIADEARHSCVREGQSRDFRELAAFCVGPSAVGIAERLTVRFPGQAHVHAGRTRTEHAVRDGQVTSSRAPLTPPCSCGLSNSADATSSGWVEIWQS